MEELVSLAFSMWLALDQLFWINVFWASHIACHNSLFAIIEIHMGHKSRQSIDHYIISPPHDTQFPLETLVWLAPILNSNEYKGTSKWHDQSSPWIRSVQVVRAVLRAWMITYNSNSCMGIFLYGVKTMLLKAISLYCWIRRAPELHH